MWWTYSAIPGTRASPSTSPRPSSKVGPGFNWLFDIFQSDDDTGFLWGFTSLMSSGDDLYDATLSDGDCRVQVTMDPGLNRLVERNILRPGLAVRHATFSTAITAQLPECSGAFGEGAR